MEPHDPGGGPQGARNGAPSGTSTSRPSAGATTRRGPGAPTPSPSRGTQGLSSRGSTPGQWRRGEPGSTTPRPVTRGTPDGNSGRWTHDVDPEAKPPKDSEKEKKQCSDKEIRNSGPNRKINPLRTNLGHRIHFAEDNISSARNDAKNTPRKMSKKTWPIFYSNSLYDMGQDFLDI